jgi:hypothetical protein
MRLETLKTNAVREGIARLITMPGESDEVPDTRPCVCHPFFYYYDWIAIAYRPWDDVSFVTEKCAAKGKSSAYVPSAVP